MFNTMLNVVFVLLFVFLVAWRFFHSSLGILMYYSILFYFIFALWANTTQNGNASLKNVSAESYMVLPVSAKQKHIPCIKMGNFNLCKSIYFEKREMNLKNECNCKEKISSHFIRREIQ